MQNKINIGPRQQPQITSGMMFGNQGMMINGTSNSVGGPSFYNQDQRGNSPYDHNRWLL